MTLILAEDTQVGESVLLPEALIRLRGGLRGAEHTHATGLPIDPVAFKVGAIRPDELSIAALVVLVINDGLIFRCAPSWRGTLLTEFVLLVHFILRVDGHHAHLAHVLQGAEIQRPEGQL